MWISPDGYASTSACFAVIGIPTGITKRAHFFSKLGQAIVGSGSYHGVTSLQVNYCTTGYSAAKKVLDRCTQCDRLHASMGFVLLLELRTNMKILDNTYIVL